MPQVDLSPLFTPPPKERTPPPEPCLVPGWKDPRTHKAPKPRSRFTLSVSQITNVLFVLAACLGAVVSVLYFIRGGELLQEVAAWPRELFYGRPVTRPTTVAIATQTSNPKQDSGDPFSPATKLLTLNSPVSTRAQTNGPISSSPTSVASPLNRLSMPAPGGDAFSRSLMDSAPTSVQSTANSAAATGQTAVSKVQQQTAPTSKRAITKPTAVIGRTRSAVTRLKSKSAHASTRHTSRSRTRGATHSTGGITVAEPGSHIGSLSDPIGSSSGAVNSAAATTRGTRGAGARAGMNAVHGIGRIRGR